MILPSPFDVLPPASVTSFTLVKGQTLFHQDDISRGAFFVAQGCVSLVRHTEAGHNVILHRAYRGELLAEASLFSDTYHCDCIAQNDSQLVRIDKNAVLAELTNGGAFANALVRRLAGQVQTYRRLLEILAIKSARDRVWAAFSQNEPTGSVVGFANSIGLTQEATYRALSELVNAGLIERYARGRYRLTQAVV